MLSRRRRSTSRLKEYREREAQQRARSATPNRRQARDSIGSSNKSSPLSSSSSAPKSNTGIQVEIETQSEEEQERIREARRRAAERVREMKQQLEERRRHENLLALAKKERVWEERDRKVRAEYYNRNISTIKANKNKLKRPTILEVEAPH